MSDTETLAAVPAKKFIHIAENGSPLIQGYSCVDCGAVALDRTLACRKCASRTPQKPFEAAHFGRVYAWTIVERSFPGVPVPFISAVVDLDDGLCLKGTLKNADPQALTGGMRVKIVFDDAGGAKDETGTPYVGFHFAPAQEGDS